MQHTTKYLVMQHTNNIDRHIEYLIKANYQRMMAYEQAAFISEDNALQTFYEERADESERNLRDLYRCAGLTDAQGEEFASSTYKNLSQIFNGRRTSMKILESVNLLEKTIMGWYKTVINEIKSLPKEIAQLVTGQYHLLEQTKLELARL